MALLCCHCGCSPTPTRQKHEASPFDHHLGFHEKNKSPSADVEKHTSQLEAEAAGFDEDIAQVEAHLQQLRESRARARSAALRHRTLNSRIYSIPVEILLEIFDLFVYHARPELRARWVLDRDEKQGPWVVGNVCRWWRSIVNNTPSLWAWIRIPTDVHISILKTTLERSGSAPMLIDVVLPQKISYPMQEVLSQKAHLLEGLYVLGDGENDLLNLLGSPDALGAFPVLRNLTLIDRSEFMDGCINSFLEPFRNCSTLETVDISLHPSPSHSGEHPAEPYPLNRQREYYERFSLMFENVNHLSLPEAYLPYILPLCANLEHLCVWGRGVEDDSPFMPRLWKTLTLSKLKSYRVYSKSRALASLKCPQLIELNALAPVGDHIAPFLLRSDCPLTTLEVEQPFSIWSPAIPIINASLTTLGLWHTTDDWSTHPAQEVIPSLIPRKRRDVLFPQLTTLSIWCAAVLKAANWGDLGLLVQTRCARPPRRDGVPTRAILTSLSIDYITAEEQDYFLPTRAAPLGAEQVEVCVLHRKLLGLQYQPGGPPKDISLSGVGTDSLLIEIVYE